MPTPIEITLPNDPALLAELQNELAPYAEVQQAPPSFDLNQVKLIIEIINGSVGIIASAASVGTFLLLLRDRYKTKAESSPIEIARLGEPRVALTSADDETIRRIISVEEFQREKK